MQVEKIKVRLTSTGQEIAPGRWSSAYSAGERTSMTASKSCSIDGPIATESFGPRFIR